ncbi:MAG: glycoside hydrolase family 2 protein [Alphaproteobacteria bacterium]|nr:glycoside hydrolase family 2 protein [Alphaproteobacteria bacterium]
MAEPGPHPRVPVVGRRARAVEGWSLASTPAGSCADPAALPEGLSWRAVAGGTVATALGLSPDSGVDLDGQDWWFRCRLPAGERLSCEGLATLTEAWLDGAPLFRSDTAFQPVDVALPAGGARELLLCFRALDAALAQRRKRPRWKVALVDHQNLRWFRTPLFGRMPGWTPPLHPVGPWRPVRVEDDGPVVAHVQTLLPGAQEGVATLRLAAELVAREGEAKLGAVRLRVGEEEHPVVREGALVQAELRLPGVPLWWPVGAGAPERVPVTLLVEVGGEEVALDLGRLGFREVAWDRTDGRVQLRVNGRALFCRGACWSAEEVRSLDGVPGGVHATLARAAAAGMNMLRVGGTMGWASPDLYEACDALGILVWQDLPLANMDHPFDDPEWGPRFRAEVAWWTRLLQPRACVVAWAGGSEVQQQAAMLGLPADLWSHPFTDDELPARVAQTHPGAACFPNSPCGGALPFHVGEGVAHYYGVGGYRRPLSDLRAAGVRFASECLAFAHVPEPASFAAWQGHPPPLPHHPSWKAGVPRDPGSGWDFDDVRDHYLRVLFGVDAAELRSLDPARALALARVVPGELMLRAFAEWRRPGSGCGGALVWLLKDLVPGAGWGVIDSTGRPKASWWYLQRAWAPRAVLLTDEGLDGVGVHVHNEGAAPLRATVELSSWRAGRSRPVAEGRVEVEVAPGGATTLSGDAIIGAFTDLAHAFRFGPPAHDVVLARLWEGDRVVHQDALFPGGHALPVQDEAGLEGALEAQEDGSLRLHLTAASFTQAVRIDAPDWERDDDHFHLAPGHEKVVRLWPAVAGAAPRVRVEALDRVGGLSLRG